MRSLGRSAKRIVIWITIIAIHCSAIPFSIASNTGGVTSTTCAGPSESLAKRWQPPTCCKDAERNQSKCHQPVSEKRLQRSSHAGRTCCSSRSESATSVTDCCQANCRCGPACQCEASTKEPTHTPYGLPIETRDTTASAIKLSSHPPVRNLSDAGDRASISRSATVKTEATSSITMCGFLCRFTL